MSEPELGAEGAIGCKTNSAPSGCGRVAEPFRVLQPSAAPSAYNNKGCTSNSAPKPHNLIPGWFTREQWRGQLAPYVDDLVSKPGGVLLLAVTIEPERQNYPDLAFAVFDATERKALRRALERCRRKRALLRQDARGDLGTVPEPNDSE